MRTKKFGKPQMITTAEITDLTRGRAIELVAHARRTTGSKMLAYAQVARLAGTSAYWIRNLIGGYSTKEPRATVYENIRLSYEAFCERIERENEIDEQRLQLLRGRPHARHQGDSKKDDFEV